MPRLESVHGIKGLKVRRSKALGKAEPLLRLLESCKFGDGVGEEALEDELPVSLLSTWLCEGDDGLKK